ncbi:MAG: ABC transporter permease [Candidatus Zixiibacteriota bacterium]
MKQTDIRATLMRLLVEYGMLIILLLLCLLFTVLTMSKQVPTGRNAAEGVTEILHERLKPGDNLLIVIPDNPEDHQFVAGLSEPSPWRVAVLSGDPVRVRSMLGPIVDTLPVGSVLVTTRTYAPLVQAVLAEFGKSDAVEIITPPTYRWPTFLLAENIKNVANQITVIAIIAIGMTMVIITAGIDLSVGSLVALSAVVVAWLIGWFGGDGASTTLMIAACLGGIVLCGVIGAFSGLMITGFGIPPFIATLAMMQVTAGIAYIISQGKPIYQVPEGFIWLGRGADPLLGIPIAVILMVMLYVVAHLLMSRTTLGRYIYAVGGNAEAARLAGIRVKRVLFFVYAVCGMLAGLGGVVMASQLKSGAPTYGLTYELYVIAAVVVGGTSLSGGQGRILGTLIGAFIIAVIQNGMNLTNVESYTQKVVLGLVILGAVMLDRLKQRGLHRRKKAAPV